MPHLAIRNPRYAFVFATFWAAYIFRMYVDTTSHAGQLSKPGADYWIWSLGVCLVPALGVLAITRLATVNKAFYASWFAMALAAALALLFGTGFVVRLDGTETDIGRLALDNLNPIAAGHLGTSLIILSGWYLISRDRSPRIRVGAAVGGIVVGLYLLVSAASRGPVVSLACVLILAMSSLRFHSFLKLVTMLSLAVLIGMLMLTSVAQIEELSIVNRILSVTSGDDMAVSARQESFAGAWHQFADNPLLGDLLEERGSAFYPHNLPLEAFMATGLVGGLAFLAICLIALSNSYRAIKTEASHAWLGMIYVQYLAGAQFSGSLYASSTFWAFAVLMMFSAGKLEDFPKKSKVQSTTSWASGTLS